MGYSLDLQARAVHFYNKYKLSMRAVADMFCIGKSSLKRWKDRLQVTETNKNLAVNDVKPQKANDKYMKNIDIFKKILDFLKKSLDHNPFQTLQMLKEKINNKFNTPQGAIIQLKLSAII